jgi:hypothetical protein
VGIRQGKSGKQNVVPDNKISGAGCYKSGGMAKKSVVAAIKKSQMKGKSSKGC